MAEVAFRADLKMATKTLEAIESAVLKNAEGGMRPHLGASLIGKSCNRALWYSFRWTTPSDHSAQLLRLFQRGHDEEPRLTKLLRDAGITVMTVDPNTGRQFAFKDGHFGGSMDGACVNVPEAPKTWHVIEYKTASAKMFNTLAAKGVKEAKPEHYAQMQVYMNKMGLTRALYITVCKDDDRLHIERIDYNETDAQSFIDKAQHIISSPVPPDGISTDPTYFECKWCDHKDLCHGSAAPIPTCRSCAHATPERDGRWECAKHDREDMSVSAQQMGCSSHLVIPILFKNWAEQIDANQEQNWISYKLLTSGFEFKNGIPTDAFSSQELYLLKEKSVLACEEMRELRKAYNGRLVA